MSQRARWEQTRIGTCVKLLHMTKTQLLSAFGITEMFRNLYLQVCMKTALRVGKLTLSHRLAG